MTGKSNITPHQAGDLDKFFRRGLVATGGVLPDRQRALLRDDRTLADPLQLSQQGGRLIGAVKYQQAAFRRREGPARRDPAWTLLRYCDFWRPFRRLSDSSASCRSRSSPSPPGLVPRHRRFHADTQRRQIRRGW